MRQILSVCDRRGPGAAMVKCKICGGNLKKVFTLKVLDKHFADYLQCDNCEFMQVKEPVWLEEAYRETISGLDTGILQRNLDLRDVAANIINKNFDPSAKFLDYGGGFGIFVRLMRDKGYDFYRYDKYCENLFAKYFDTGNDLGKITDRFELITAFEVFEHLENPLSEICEIFKLSDSLFFTTLLIPKDIKDLAEWWYLGAETGQHISFYSKNSLEVIADKFKAVFYSDGFHHILTRRRISDPFRGENKYKFRVIAEICKRINNFLYHDKINKSLIWQDFEYIRRNSGKSKKQLKSACHHASS